MYVVDELPRNHLGKVPFPLALPLFELSPTCNHPGKVNKKELIKEMQF